MRKVVTIEIEEGDGNQGQASTLIVKCDGKEIRTQIQGTNVETTLQNLVYALNA